SFDEALTSQWLHPSSELTNSPAPRRKRGSPQKRAAKPVEPASLLSFRLDDRYWTGHQRCFKPVTLKSQVFCCTRAGLAVLLPAPSRHNPLFTLTRAQPKKVNTSWNCWLPKP